MKIFKNAMIISVITLFINSIYSQNDEIKKVGIKIKQIKCKVHSPEYLVLKYCFVKPYSRTVATANVGVDVLKKVRGPIDIRIGVFKKYITRWQEMYPTISFEYCAAMKNEGMMGMLVNYILSFFRDSVPQLFRTCPFPDGILDMKNISVTIDEMPMSKMIPSGLYKVSRVSRTFCDLE